MDLFTIDTKGSLNVQNDVSESEEETDNSLGDENEVSEVLHEEESKESDDLDEESEEEEDLFDDADDESAVESMKADDSEDSGDEEETVSITQKLNLFSEVAPRSKKVIVKPRKNVFDFRDVYINCEVNDFGKSSATDNLKDARKTEVDKLLATKSIAHIPGFNQMECLPHSDLSKQKAKKLRKAEREKTKGDKWFNMPATEITEEVKRDLEVLQMRSVLDPKTFYKKNDLKVLPKYFQVGRVMDNAADFYHSRVPKKERKRTMVDELLADAEFQQRSKQKFKEIVAEKQQFKSKAHKQAKRLKRKKK